MGIKEALNLRRIRLFADRCTAGIEDGGVREEFRRRFHRRVGDLVQEGKQVRLDPRFHFRAGPEDIQEERLGVILRGFNA